LIGNVKFFEELDEDEKAVFEEGFKISSQVEGEKWNEAVEEAKKEAQNMGVKFYYPDTEPFKEAVIPLHKEVLENNEKLAEIYEKIKG
jgi:TRAP-type C4-dicarboxylate transport system substrate-binding protein